MPSRSLSINVLRAGIGFLLLLLPIAPWVARADQHPPPSLSPGDRVAIRKVIEGQLAAFRRDDGGTAFSFAAPEIQTRFKTPENFMRMVRQRYRMLYRPLQIHFKMALTGKKQTVQPVLATGEDGLTVIALYIMIRMPGGKWRIDAVVLLPTDQKGAGRGRWPCDGTIPARFGVPGDSAPSSGAAWILDGELGNGPAWRANAKSAGEASPLPAFGFPPLSRYFCTAQMERGKASYLQLYSEGSHPLLHWL